MAGATTSTLLGAVRSKSTPTLFLSGFFKSPPKNFYTTEKVEIDIVRSGEQLAIAIKDISSSARFNSNDIYTNKQFTAPIFSEEAALNSFDLLDRIPGANPYQNIDFQANVVAKSFDVVDKMVDKIRRTNELQASQALQTGAITLVDNAGNDMYSVDFKSKASHLPTAGVTWGQVGADPMGDLLSLGNVIKGDGFGSIVDGIFGETAMDEFKKDSEVKAQLDNRRMNIGGIEPKRAGKGAVFQGTIWIGSYQLNLWTYPGTYEDPQTGLSTPYVDKGKVILLSDNSVLDATFGAIPTIAPPDQDVLGFIPSRISDVEGGMDMNLNAYFSRDKTSLFMGVKSRPLMIPTLIDTIGCLDTGL